MPTALSGLMLMERPSYLVVPLPQVLERRASQVASLVAQERSKPGGKVEVAECKELLWRLSSTKIVLALLQSTSRSSLADSLFRPPPAAPWARLAGEAGHPAVMLLGWCVEQCEMAAKEWYRRLRRGLQAAQSESCC